MICSTVLLVFFMDAFLSLSTETISSAMG